MAVKQSPIDWALDAAAGIALVGMLVLIWVHSWIVVQVIATALFVAVVLWVVAGRAGHGRQRAPTFRAPRPTRRDTISQPTPPTVESEDQWEAIERDTGRPEEAGGED